MKPRKTDDLGSEVMKHYDDDQKPTDDLSSGVMKKFSDYECDVVDLDDTFMSGRWQD